MRVIKYYIEVPVLGERRIGYVVAQDETGIYRSHSNDSTRIYQIRGVEMEWAKLEDWPAHKEVETTSWDYLEFIRLWERNSYMTTRPTEIKTVEGESAVDVIKSVIGAGIN